MIDWGVLLTTTLTVVIQLVAPAVVAAVLAWAAKQWGDLKATNKMGAAFRILEDVAYQLVLAAEQKTGIDTNEEKHDFVFAQLKNLATKLPIKFSDEQLDTIVDSILEGAVMQRKIQETGMVLGRSVISEV